MAKRASRSSEPPSLTAQMRVCVFHGPEDFLRRHYLQQLRVVIEAEHGEVDVITFEGKDADLADVLDEVRSFGLIQSHKIVVVDEADAFVSTHREPLERYAANPVDHATLVFRSGKWNAGKLDKLIAKVGCIIKCESPTPAVTNKWLAERARHHRCKLDRAAADALVARLGCDLGLLDSELAKLAVVVGEGNPITAQTIDELVGRSSDEQAYAIQEAVLGALAQGRDGVGKAISLVQELIELSRQAEVLVSYFVADLFGKLYIGSMMKRQGASDAEISREMKLWGPRVGPFMAVLRSYDSPDLARLFSRIVAADQRAKSGAGDSRRNLECFFASMTDVRR